jgi:hypothetical protein
MPRGPRRMYHTRSGSKLSRRNDAHSAVASPLRITPARLSTRFSLLPRITLRPQLEKALTTGRKLGKLRALPWSIVANFGQVFARSSRPAWWFAADPARRRPEGGETADAGWSGGRGSRV